MATAAMGQGSREIIVTIGQNAEGNLEASPEYFKISKSRNEEVRWVCAVDHKHSPGGPCFTVDFESNGSPFYESQFSSDAPFSGPARRAVLPGPKVYKYTVRAGDKTLDPGGGVQQ